MKQNFSWREVISASILSICVGAVFTAKVLPILKTRKKLTQKPSKTRPKTKPLATKITNFKSVDMEKSNFVKPRSLYFNQEGRRRRWDCVKGHDAVVCLCFHKETQSFIFVRQFRPAVYYAELKRNGWVEGEDLLESCPLEKGFTYELVAGIMDKEKSKIETVKEEILEEAGFDVPLDQIHEAYSYISSVGLVGSRATMFYAFVSDQQKVSEGGGIEGEEFISVQYISASEYKELKINKEPIPSGLIGIMEWFLHKYPEFNDE